MSVTDDIAEHLRIALIMLDEAGHHKAAAYVSMALDALDEGEQAHDDRN